MFDSSKIYKMIKPDSNPDLITSLPLIIGGTTAVPDLISGAVIIHPINNMPVTSQYKNMKDVDPLISDEKGSSKIELTYQIDIYKQNANNIKYIEVEREAINIQEWLKSFEVQEYLESLDAEILPNYTPIKLFMNVEHNKHFINRASFDFAILTNSSIFEKINIIENIVFDKTIILQGEATNE